MKNIFFILSFSSLIYAMERQDSVVWPSQDDMSRANAPGSNLSTESDEILMDAVRDVILRNSLRADRDHSEMLQRHAMTILSRDKHSPLIDQRVLSSFVSRSPDSIRIDSAETLRYLMDVVIRAANESLLEQNSATQASLENFSTRMSQQSIPKKKIAFIVSSFTLIGSAFTAWNLSYKK